MHFDLQLNAANEDASTTYSQSVINLKKAKTMFFQQSKRAQQSTLKGSIGKGSQKRAQNNVESLLQGTYASLSTYFPHPHPLLALANPICHFFPSKKAFWAVFLGK